MVNRLLDYNAVVPAPIVDGSTPIPLTPAGVGIAAATVNIPAGSTPNFVELNGSVGVNNTAGPGRILFRVFRGPTEIYYSEVGLDEVTASFGEQFYLFSIQMVDANVSAGTQGYTLSVESLTSTLAASVVGPVVWDALAIGT